MYPLSIFNGSIHGPIRRSVLAAAKQILKQHRRDPLPIKVGLDMVKFCKKLVGQ